MGTASATRQHAAHLDMLRGTAALLVLFSHLRTFLIVDFGSATKGYGLPEFAFYFLTGLGQQAVMVFFVLSGLFIYGAIERATVRGTWSWLGYGVDRLSRLWVVLIPALLFTFFWDSLGQVFSSSRFYQGELFDSFHNGLDGIPVAHDWFTLAGNLAFLNTIAVESYGSSSQLWSLANEAWYYLLFPLWLFGVLRRSPVMLGAAAAIILVLPFHIQFLFPVWLFGAALHEFHRRGWGNRLAASKWFLWGTAWLFAGVLVASRMHLLPFLVNEYAVGLSAAALIYALLHAPSPKGGFYRRLASWLSRISYTLYLSHLAFLIALLSIALDGRRLPLTATSFAIFLGVIVLALVYAGLLYHLFERHTGLIRKRLHCLLERGLVAQGGAG